MAADTDFDTVRMDLKGMLAHLSGIPAQDWSEYQGQDSGSGLDYWYQTEAGIDAYVNVDQTTISISITDEEGETLHSTTFDFDETPADHWSNGLVVRHAASPSP